MSSVIQIWGGPPCGYARSLAANDLYWELDFQPGTRGRGCGFCVRDLGPRRGPRREPVEEAWRQIREAGAGPSVYRLHDSRLFGRLRRLSARVLEGGLPPSTFVFQPRLEEFLRHAALLEEALPALDRLGHRVRLLSMAAASLAEEDNALYNNGVTLRLVDEAGARLRGLAARFPRAFAHEPPVRFIAASPWTTLEAFSAGLELGLARGLEPAGEWLWAPLRLRPGAALTRLAERQGGILVGKAPDPSLIYGGAADGGAAWRFTDERMAAAFALVARFCAAALRRSRSDSVFRGDAAYAALLEARAAAASFGRPDRFAQDAAAVARTARAPLEPRALLRAALERHAARRKKGLWRAGPLGAAGGCDPRLRGLLEALLRRFSGRLGGATLRGAAGGWEAGSVVVDLAFGGEACRLAVTGRGAVSRFFLRTRHLAAVCAPETGAVAAARRAELGLLLELFERALSRRVPPLLPPAAAR